MISLDLNMKEWEKSKASELDQIWAVTLGAYLAL